MKEWNEADELDAGIAYVEHTGSLDDALALMPAANDLAARTLAWADQYEKVLQDLLTEFSDDPEKIKQLKPLLAEVQDMKRGLENR